MTYVMYDIMNNYDLITQIIQCQGDEKPAPEHMCS